MADRRRCSVLLPAAGEGSRLGLGPKALLDLAGASMLQRVVETAREVSDDIIVGVPAAHVETIARQYSELTVMAGGSSRQQTIEELLRCVDRDWVIVHDVARPLCTADLMWAVVAAAEETGGAAVVGPVDVPVVLVEEGLIKAHVPARDARLCQSPLAFRTKVLRAAYRHAAATGLEYASTLELIVAAGFAVRAVDGTRRNIKITTRSDLLLATALLAADNEQD